MCIVCDAQPRFHTGLLMLGSACGSLTLTNKSSARQTPRCRFAQAFEAQLNPPNFHYRNAAEITRSRSHNCLCSLMPVLERATLSMLMLSAPANLSKNGKILPNITAGSAVTTCTHPNLQLPRAIPCIQSCCPALTLGCSAAHQTPIFPPLIPSNHQPSLLQLRNHVLFRRRSQSSSPKSAARPRNGPSWANPTPTSRNRS